MTEVKEFEIIVCNKDSPKKTWTENIEIPINVDPRKFIEKLVTEFNKEEDRRKDDNPNYLLKHRQFVDFKGETGKSNTYCDLTGKKFNYITMFLGNLSYDILRCPHCLKFYQRVGLGQNFNYDTNPCKPELLCNPCNRTFTNAKLLQKHNEIGKHETPKWLISVSNLTGAR